MIRILIADDHKIFRDGLVSLLAQEPDLQVVGQASSGQEVINQCENLPACDLVILDIHMPGMPGEAICKWIKEKYPKLPVLVLSMHDESTYILKMLEAGASGYLLKEAGLPSYCRPYGRFHGETPTIRSMYHRPFCIN